MDNQFYFEDNSNCILLLFKILIFIFMVMVHVIVFLLKTSWTAEWITEYHQSRPGLKVLPQKNDDLTTALEAQLEQVFSSVFLFFRPLCFHRTWSSILSIKLLLPKKNGVFSDVSPSVILNLIFNHNVF